MKLVKCFECEIIILSKVLNGLVAADIAYPRKTIKLFYNTKRFVTCPLYPIYPRRFLLNSLAIPLGKIDTLALHIYT